MHGRKNVRADTWEIDEFSLGSVQSSTFRPGTLLNSAINANGSIHASSWLDSSAGRKWRSCGQAAGFAFSPVLLAFLLKERRIANAVMYGLPHSLYRHVVIKGYLIGGHGLRPNGSAEERLGSQAAALDEILLITRTLTWSQVDIVDRLGHDEPPTPF